MIKGFYDKDELLSKIYDHEGFDYFFRSWLSADDIEDPRLRDLVGEYQEAADRLEDYIEDALF